MKLIGRDGFDGLTTRKLAEEAGVTTPTLYNLIGNKDEIVRQAFEANVEAVWSLLEFGPDDDTIAMAEKIVRESAQFVLADEDANRELILATDRIFGFYAAKGDIVAEQSVASLRSIEMGETVCQRAIERGQIEPLLGADTLGQQMFVSYRGPLRDWAHGLISAAEMQRRQMLGFYLVLASLARAEFRAELHGKIAMIAETVSQWSRG